MPSATFLMEEEIARVRSMVMSFVWLFAIILIAIIVWLTMVSMCRDSKKKGCKNKDKKKKSCPTSGTSPTTGTDLALSGSLTVGANATVNGNSTVEGDQTVGGDLTVTGDSSWKHYIIESTTATSFAVVTGVQTPIPFDTDQRNENWDTDRTTNTAEFIVPRDGDYEVYASVTWGTPGGGTFRDLHVVVNGTVRYSETELATSVLVGTFQSIYVPINLVAGDILTLQVTHNNGTTNNIGSGARMRIYSKY